MSRGDADPEETIDRLAHAFTPAEWKGRNLAMGILLLAGVLTVTVIQRALVADTTTEWLITGVHALIVVILVPVLSVKTLREWRRVHSR